ncbi:thioredoxin reductase (NADPH) [Fistulifera solaris]|uniref:Thioredoxin reductase (NADPH) n=1 Tax=Fistulifera solaris TaxID=1519565 RepID=A0A1Z5KBP3_FISSO|nr:thioredoxin reductase (NADPH) [Fistulifera solaris]|eukprot:GAX23679.1 thioredoxin reductase (NADPH) [Fistulifera solaris]
MLRKRARQTTSFLPILSRSSARKGSKRTPYRLLVAATTAIAAVFLFFRSLRSDAKNVHRSRLLHSTTSTPPHPDGTYDVIILGSGPAGLSAAVFAARSTLSVLVLGSLHGGLLSEATSLENFPGYTSTDSLQWLQSTQKQAQDWGATMALPGLTAQSITQSNHTFQIKTELKVYQSRALIVATGATPRRLHLPKEDDFWGTFIHSCAICDASAYGPHDTVLVVGGGDAAVAAALYLSRIVGQVIVVHRQTDFTRPKNYAAVEQMKSSPKVRVLTPYVVTSWMLDPSQTLLVGAQLEHASSKKRMEVKVHGAFLLIGAIPNTGFLRGLVALNEEGFIAVSRDNQGTSIPGLFAAGEVVLDRGGYRQAITAAAQGAQAAMDAERWLAQRGRLEAGPRNDGAIQRRVMRTDPPRPAEGCDLTQIECLKDVVHKYPLVVFSKFSCPYCGMALEALGIIGANPHVIDLTYYGPKAHLVQTALAQLTGRRTVPNVFIGGESIGGGQETVQFQRSGQLKEKLLLAGAL